jgi:hypothetical protein
MRPLEGEALEALNLYLAEIAAEQRWREDQEQILAGNGIPEKSEVPVQGNAP